eukprot:scaffold30089_cov61-Attheya_sp.AAC.1
MASQTATSQLPSSTNHTSEGPVVIASYFVELDRTKSFIPLFTIWCRTDTTLSDDNITAQYARCPREWSAAGVGSIFVVEFGLGLTHVVAAFAECALGECMSWFPRRKYPTVTIEEAPDGRYCIQTINAIQGTKPAGRQWNDILTTVLTTLKF